MYFMQTASLIIFILTIFLSAGCPKNLDSDNALFMKKNVCVKIVDATDESLFQVNVLKDGSVIKTVSNRIIKSAQEQLNKSFIGAISSTSKGEIGCDNKEIYILKLEMDAFESENQMNPNPFGLPFRSIIRIKYKYSFSNKDGKVLFMVKTDDNDPSLSDLSEQIGEKIADKIIDYNFVP